MFKLAKLCKIKEKRPFGADHGEDYAVLIAYIIGSISVVYDEIYNEGMKEYNYHLTKKDNYCPECEQLVDEYCFGMECSECHIIKTRLEDMC